MARGRAGSRQAAAAAGPSIIPRPSRRPAALLLLLCCCAAAALAVAPRRGGPAAAAAVARSAAAAAPPPPPPPPTRRLATATRTPFRPDLPLLDVGRPLPPRPSEAECRDLLRQYVEDHPAAPVPYRRPDGGSGGGGDGNPAPPPPTTPAPRLFFLHIPRTAGRTIHYCLLVQGTRPRWRCPRAYAGVSLEQPHQEQQQQQQQEQQPPPPPPPLPLAAAAHRCHLLSSHDDFSLAQAIASSSPPSSSEGEAGGTVAAVTQLRDPVQRILSAYEFVTTHALNLAKLSAEEEAQLDALGREQGRLDTFVTRVWPWSELVPVVVKDVRERRGRLGLVGPSAVAANGLGVARERGGGGKGEGSGDSAPLLSPPPPRNPYDSPDVAMPLADFLRLPLARDLLFDGQAMQVLGLTANSRWPHAGALRACALRPPPPPPPATTTARAQDKQGEEEEDEGEKMTGGAASFAAHSFSSANSSSSTLAPPLATWSVREALLALASSRLAAFAHAGVAERVRESAEAAAAALGLDVVAGPAYGRKGTALDYEDDEDGEEEGEEEEEDGGLASAVEEAAAEGRLATAGAAAAAAKAAARRRRRAEKGVGKVQALPLGGAFLRCAARYREADKRAGRAAAETVPVPPGAPPMRAFGGGGVAAAAGGGNSPSFAAASTSTSSARAALIPPELLAWLAEQNRMDARLHELADAKLDAARAAARARGALRELSREEERRAAALAAAAADGPVLEAMKGLKEQQQQGAAAVVV